MTGRTEARTSDLVIDEGFRHWYKACPCCLSEAHPGVKQELDREREEATRVEAESGGRGSTLTNSPSVT